MNLFQTILRRQFSLVTMGISVITVAIPLGQTLAQPSNYSVNQARYPNDVVQSYLQGCNADGQHLEFCRCTIEKLQQRYSLTQFETLANQMVSTGSIPQSLLKVASECVKTPTTIAAEPSNPSEIEQLNNQLQQAVARKNWNQAIQVVDRMILLFPEQANELQAYRRRLEALRQP